MDGIGYTGAYERFMCGNWYFCQILVNLVIIAVGPLLTSVVYYCDVGTDIVQVITLATNCHYKYSIASCLIIVISYFTTVWHLIYFLKQPAKKAFLYPFYHS